MSKVVLTGSGGFLGGHTRAAILEQGETAVPLALGEGFDLETAAHAISEASQVIHIAGVNRGTDEEVGEGNELFAKQLAAAITTADTPPKRVAYANSTQSKSANVYGHSKGAAAATLAEASATVGAEFADVVLPNLFGEHGRPFYNSVTATFSHLLAIGEQPTVANDQVLTLMHAQNAADLLLGSADVSLQSSFENDLTVSALLEKLNYFAETYGRGDIPDIVNELDRDLFNTYRSFTFPTSAPIALTRHSDSRGSFFEVVRTRGGTGQYSFSTTEPGISRGDHFHRRKVERFTVLSGTAKISLRRLFTSDVVTFSVTGDSPVAVDMPTMWSHKITNTGDSTLYTSFWANDIFDPNNPDTIAEAVA
jgi:UDP-2-acetamido-2,6-beta-L-arabino-hexul-4-ose reductase